jgi:hypothetical protein
MDQMKIANKAMTGPPTAGRSWLSFDCRTKRMSFTLENVVPWGRSFDEYVAMFGLTDADLQCRLLGCGDGPAAFNAELTRQGGNVVSVDPLYRLSRDEIRRRIDVTYPEVIAQTEKNRHEFNWTDIKSVDDLGRLRMAAMDAFLSDYSLGLNQKRYVDGELPCLPFADGSSDIAVCSHLLLLYSEQLSEDFHVASLKELCRIANETRIFPIMELGARESRHLRGVTTRLTQDGYFVTIETVLYEFQRGGNQMMRIRTVEQGGGEVRG